MYIYVYIFISIHIFAAGVEARGGKKMGCARLTGDYIYTYTFRYIYIYIYIYRRWDARD